MFPLTLSNFVFVELVFVPKSVNFVILLHSLYSRLLVFYCLKQNYINHNIFIILIFFQLRLHPKSFPKECICHIKFSNSTQTDVSKLKSCFSMSIILILRTLFLLAKSKFHNKLQKLYCIIYIGTCKAMHSAIKYI